MRRVEWESWEMRCLAEEEASARDELARIRAEELVAAQNRLSVFRGEELPQIASEHDRDEVKW